MLDFNRCLRHNYIYIYLYVGDLIHGGHGLKLTTKSTRPKIPIKKRILDGAAPAPATKSTTTSDATLAPSKMPRRLRHRLRPDEMHVHYRLRRPRLQLRLRHTESGSSNENQSFFFAFFLETAFLCHALSEYWGATLHFTFAILAKFALLS